MAKLGSKRLISTGVPILICGLYAVEASAQSKPMVAEIMPPAKSGECYAKVSVPAKYRTEMVDVLLKAPTERYQISPAKFENRSKQVMTRQASSTIKAVPPVLAVEKDKFLVTAASTQWVRDSLKGKVPLSEGEKRDLSAAGVKIEEVPVGSCLYEHFREATVKSVPNQVLISEATETLSTTPAKYRKGTESVLVKAGFKRLIEVPAVFKKKQDRVLVEAAHSVWQKGTGPIQKIDNETGEIMCRIDVPADYKVVDVDVIATAPIVTSVTEKAVYKTINIEKLEADAKEMRVPVAAQFRTMNKEQVQSPGGFTWSASRAGSASDGEHTGRVVCNQALPAKEIAYERTVVRTAGRFERVKVEPTFENVSVSELIADASSVKIPVPGVNSKVERRVKVDDSRFEWQAVLCETNTTGDIITRLQAALQKEGFAPGSIDGVLGQSTLSALEKYQQKNKLAEGGVTMESVRALGVEL